MFKNITIAVLIVLVAVLIVLVAVLGFLALDGRFQNPLPDLQVQSPVIFGETEPATPIAETAPETDEAAPDTAAAEADVPAVIYTDLCADQVNPAWGALISQNGLEQAVYETWLAEVKARGGTVFGASKCSISVDSRIYGPGLVKGFGPTQLVTAYRADGIWHPYVDANYDLATSCGFTPWFNQGDAPVAVYVDGNTVQLQNPFSNGVSIIGMVTCGQ